MAPDSTLALIERIYDAALAPESLPPTLVRISEAVHGHQECVLAEGPSACALSVVAPRGDPAYVQSLRDDWPHRGDRAFEGLVQRLRAMPAGRALDLRRAVDPRELTETAFYREWWCPQGLGTAPLMIRFAAAHGAWGVFSVHPFRNHDGGFEPAGAALLDTLAPHLARALSLQQELARLACERHAGAGDDDRGLFLLDAHGRLVFANGLAEGWLASDDRFRLQGGRLTLNAHGAGDALAHLVSRSTRPSSRGGARGGSLVVRGKGPHDALRVEAIPFRAEAAGADLGWLALFRPAAVLVVTDAGTERSRRRTRLRRRFGLTPVESEVALEIARGDGRKAVAARMGVTLATVRTHLTRIFDKTGVRRQAELVRLLSSGDEPPLH